MSDHQNRIDQLNQKLEVLLSKQEGFAKELMALYREIEALKNKGNESPRVEKVTPPQIEKEQPKAVNVTKEEVSKEILE